MFLCQPAVSHICDLGEGPVWDPEQSSLYWVDINGCQIHRLAARTGELTSIKTPSRVGSFALRERGGLIAAMENGIYLIDTESGECTAAVPEAENVTGNRFNDGKCDPAGRFWAGSMSTISLRDQGSLYRIDSDFNIENILSPVSCSNGLAWNKEASQLYFIDTPTRQLAVFDYDNQTGAISNKKIVQTFGAEDGFPDGMTIDGDGMLWIAFWNGWKVMRVDPRSGKTLTTFKLPVSRVTSCTFGGENLEDLYITTAKTNLTEAELEHQPLAGSLFVIKSCGYKGTESIRFRG